MSSQLEERMAIHDLFNRLAQAWDAGDGAAYGQCFSEDADYVTFSGEHLKGRQAIDTVHQKLWHGVLRGSKLINQDTDMSLRFITPELAIAHATGVVQLRFHKTPPKARQSINTNVLVKINGEWKVAAFHNCRIKRPNWIQRWMMRSK
ncbi:SgcJ/EcaC family oxidoreductase [Paenibacillus terrigena]|uniref:SgcJ/EcaC family oxidoreductase n=1 Tax=Paenibacillus terrigena TaxID=369333 RepID=UPI0028D50852|nr:SgcJ/EcaC family oxidoreductase [Paenibacillus terrigena]